MEDETEEDSVLTIEQLRERLAEAEAAADAFGPTPQQLREEAAAAEQLAKENGVPAKSAKVIETLRRRWSEFIDVTIRYESRF